MYSRAWCLYNTHQSKAGNLQLDLFYQVYTGCQANKQLVIFVGDRCLVETGPHISCLNSGQALLDTPPQLS